jgi:hypothetical protein
MNARGSGAMRSYSKRRARGSRSGFCFLLVALSSSPLSAQEAQPNSYAGFEGRNVAQVEISTRPTLNA